MRTTEARPTNGVNKTSLWGYSAKSSVKIKNKSPESALTSISPPGIEGVSPLEKPNWTEATANKRKKPHVNRQWEKLI